MLGVAKADGWRRQGWTASVSNEGPDARWYLERTRGAHRQHEPGVDSQSSLVDCVERGTQLSDTDLGEKPDVANVYPQDGRVDRSRDPHPAQEGTVPTNRDDEIRMAQSLGLVGGAARAISSAVRQHVLIEARHRVLGSPLAHLLGDGDGLGLPIMNNQTDPFDQRVLRPMMMSLKMSESRLRVFTWSRTRVMADARGVAAWYRCSAFEINSEPMRGPTFPVPGSPPQ